MNLQFREIKIGNFFGILGFLGKFFSDFWDEICVFTQMRKSQGLVMLVFGLKMGVFKLNTVF